MLALCQQQIGPTRVHQTFGPCREFKELIEFLMTSTTAG